MRMTPAVKNLLIINVLMFAAAYVFSNSLSMNLNDLLGLHYVTAPSFGIWQFVSFIFMHSGVSHIFFNMFALWMFGTLIEETLGTKRFITYYLICGIGSGIIQQIALTVDMAPTLSAIDNILNHWDPDAFKELFATQIIPVSHECVSLMNKFAHEYNELIGSSPEAAASAARTFLMTYQDLYVDAHVTVGASGAVYGILLATGMMFPNMPMYIMFIPIPIKAKWVVIGYGVIELLQGTELMGYDNVAHWAHLGGMIFGIIVLKMWRVGRVY